MNVKFVWLRQQNILFFQIPYFSKKSLFFLVNNGFREKPYSTWKLNMYFYMFYNFYLKLYLIRSMVFKIETENRSKTNFSSFDLEKEKFSPIFIIMFEFSVQKDVNLGSLMNIWGPTFSELYPENGWNNKYFVETTKIWLKQQKNVWWLGNRQIFYYPKQTVFSLYPLWNCSFLTHS